MDYSNNVRTPVHKIGHKKIQEKIISNKNKEDKDDKNVSFFKK